MRPLRILVIILALMFCISYAGVAAVRLPGMTETKHFIIHYPSGMGGTAIIVGGNCEDWLAEISRKLELKNPPVVKIPVSLYRNQPDFTEATGRQKPGDVVGQASSDGSVEIEASGYLVPVDQIAGHEITHIVIFRIMGPNIGFLPLWVNEGTAKYFTDDWDDVDQTIFADAATNGTLIPLSSLTDGFPEGKAQGLAYAESTSAIRYFVKTYGEHALARLIHETARTGSFNTSMKEVTGITPQEFESRWLRDTTGSFISPQMMQAARAIGLASFIIVGIAAYLAMRRRKRRIIEQYEREEWEQANWRDWGGDI